MCWQRLKSPVHISALERERKEKRLMLFVTNVFAPVVTWVRLPLSVCGNVNDIAPRRRKDTTLAWTLITEVNTQHGWGSSLQRVLTEAAKTMTNLAETCLVVALWVNKLMLLEVKHIVKGSANTPCCQQRRRRQIFLLWKNMVLFYFSTPASSNDKSLLQCRLPITSTISTTSGGDMKCLSEEENTS